MAGEGFNLGTAYGYIEIDTSGVDRAIKGAQQSFSGGIQSIGSSISGFGSSLTTIFTPISIALGKATKDTLDYNEAITNIQAVTGASADETKRLSDELLLIGQNSRARPQEVANAFYDIAGGVSDASVRMDTLKAALAASEAGSADLGSTVSALISIMNGYGFSADQAGHASDVLTQVVNKGVGTMDQFASALPNVAGLANSVGISFDDLGSMMAYLTTKGVSANEASTQLSGAISALIKPSKAMEDALKKIGFESGTAAIQQLGLVGTYEKLKESGADVNKITGPIEGLRGVIALTGGDFENFSGQFNTGLDGITEKTRAIQDASPAAQMDLFNSTLSTLSITVGETLLPALNDMLQSIMPIIQSVIDWVKQNPELTGQILMIVGALGVLGPILIAVGAAIGAIGGIIGFVLSPIGLIIAAIVGLGIAFATNFGGIRDAVQPILDQLSNTIQTVVLPALATLADWFITTALPAIIAFIQTTVIPGVQGFIDLLVGIWTTIQPGLQALWDWFTVTALPAIVNFVQTTVIPGIQTFFTFLGNAWAVIGPALASLADWFITTALPAIVNFIQTTVIPGVQGFIDLLVGIWNTIQPGLQSLWDWFTVTALPAIVNFVQTTVIPGVQGFIDLLLGIWTQIQPGLQALYDFFVTTAIPAVILFIQTVVIPNVQAFIDLLVGIWNTIQPGLQSLLDWFTVTALPAVVDFVTNTVIPAVQGFIDILVGIWTVVQPGIDSLKNGISDAFNWIKDNIITPVNTKFTEFGQTIENIKTAITNFLTGPINDFKNTMSDLGNSLFGEGSFLGGIGQTVGQLGQIGGAVLGSITGHDYPGGYSQNAAYLVGTGAQPEAFIPSTGGGGMAIPNFDKVLAGMSGGGGITTGPITINANSYAEGQQAARGFKEEIDRIYQSRGGNR